MCIPESVTFYSPSIHGAELHKLLDLRAVVRDDTSGEVAIGLRDFSSPESPIFEPLRRDNVTLRSLQALKVRAP